jgi:hypothetical protein
MKLRNALLIGIMATMSSRLLLNMDTGNISTKTSVPQQNTSKRSLCLICHGTIRSISLYTSHICKPPTKTIPACRFCGKSTFKYEDSLSFHERYCRKNPSREKFHCPSCKKKYTTKSNLTRHIKNIHENVSKDINQESTLKHDYNVAPKVILPMPDTMNEELFKSFFK